MCTVFMFLFTQADKTRDLTLQLTDSGLHKTIYDAVSHHIAYINEVTNSINNSHKAAVLNNNNNNNNNENSINNNDDSNETGKIDDVATQQAAQTSTENNNNNSNTNNNNNRNDSVSSTAPINTSRSSNGFFNKLFQGNNKNNVNAVSNNNNNNAAANAANAGANAGSNKNINNKIDNTASGKKSNAAANYFVSGQDIAEYSIYLNNNTSNNNSTLPNSSGKTSKSKEESIVAVNTVQKYISPTSRRLQSVVLLLSSLATVYVIDSESKLVILRLNSIKTGKPLTPIVKQVSGWLLLLYVEKPIVIMFYCIMLFIFTMSHSAYLYVLGSE